MKAPRPIRVWRIPLLLAGLTMFGLLAALLGEALGWKIAAWIALAMPVSVGLWLAAPRRG